MGEIAINPIHNVHKKYRTMNLVNSYIFTPPVTYNTYIGGISASVSSAASLASKLGISVGAISNFTVVGSDIKCKITGSYAIPLDAFNFNYTPCSYYKDTDYLVTSIGDEAFYATQGFVGYDADFKNCLSVGPSAFSAGNGGGGANKYLLKNATSIGNNCFAGCNKTDAIYIPSCTSLGTTSGNDNVFYNNDAPLKSGIKIYAHPSLATNNAGSPDGDLAWVIANRQAVVIYVTNFNAPNPVTTLAAGTIYNTAIQLNFTVPSSTNAIEYYECYSNGLFKNIITGSGQYITGLSQNTTQTITLKPVDIFYNKSNSNIISQSTSNYAYTDTDANAYISAASLTGAEKESAYLLITELKTNALYTKCQAIYPFKGTTSSQHKFNAKNPIDTDGAFRLTFTGAATFSNLGYQLNGSSYANTYFIPSAQQSVNNNGITVVCGTNNVAYSSDVIEVGAYNSGSQRAWVGAKNNNTNYSRNATLNATAIAHSGVNEARGIFTGVRQSSTVTDLFVNGTQVATGNSGGTLPTVSAYIGCMNLNGTAYGNSNQRIQMAILHDGLSDSEVGILNNIIDLSETIAGRKTW